MTPEFPLVGLGAPSDGIPSLLPAGNTWQGSIAPTSQTNPFDVGGALGKAGKAVGGVLGKAYDAATKNSFLGMLFGSDYQYLTGIIGLILIAAGIFLFRPVRETVISAGKTAAKGAALAA